MFRISFCKDNSTTRAGSGKGKGGRERRRRKEGLRREREGREEARGAGGRRAKVIV